MDWEEVSYREVLHASFSMAMPRYGSYVLHRPNVAAITMALRITSCTTCYNLTYLVAHYYTFAVIFMCLVGVVFPIGFMMAELGGQPYLLPPSFNVGYSYFLFYLSIAVSIVAILATNQSFNRCFRCHLIRTTPPT